MINKQFPSAYDVEQTIKFRSTQYEDARRYLQSLGLLIFGSGKDHLSLYASSMLLEHNDYVTLRSIAQGSGAATNISGFILQTTVMPKTLEDICEDLVFLRNRLISQEAELIKKGSPKQRLNMPQIHDGKLLAKFEYQRTILGRVELIQRVDTEVECVVEPVDHQLWRVVCFPQANQDVKKLESIFKKLDGGSYAPLIISLSGFTQKQRIQFFDDILDYYSANSEWRFLEVTEISMRQDTGNDYLLLDSEDEIETVDFDVEEADETDLLSITQAVLQGQRLRTNSFVKKCEHQGFYFPSMTLSLDNRQTSEQIQITIRFKLSPKMFEVILANMSDKTEIGDIPTSFSYERQQAILREFWLTSHNIWQDINQQLPRKTELQQMTFANDNSDLIQIS